MIGYMIFGWILSYAIFNLLMSSCVIQHDGNGKIITPTPKATLTPTPRPRLTAIPTYPPATPEPTAGPTVVEAPAQAEQCSKILVKMTGPRQADDVVIWAEKKHHIGRMFFDAATGQKYLGVKMNSPGDRELHFKINGQWLAVHKILIVPKIENCAQK